MIYAFVLLLALYFNNRLGKVEQEIGPLPSTQPTSPPAQLGQQDKCYIDLGLISICPGSKEISIFSADQKRSKNTPWMYSGVGPDVGQPGSVLLSTDVRYLPGVSVTGPNQGQQGIAHPDYPGDA